MCGRAAQTNHAVLAATSALASSASAISGGGSDSGGHAQAYSITTSDTRFGNAKGNNFNMAPGMSAQVFVMKNNHDDGNKDHGDNADDCTEIFTCGKTWGLVPRNGTTKSPLPTGMSQHFSNLMFNARSDTLFEKSTFRGLVAKGRTCLVAVDGFFEWKASPTKGKKQPYFVYRKKSTTTNNENGAHSYLLLAGLWTSVKTGRSDDPVLDTFTIITTASCPSLNWFHDRQPLFVWDTELGKQWLQQPTIQLLRQMETVAEHTPFDFLDWHAVTTNMSKTSYRKEDSIKALPPPVTVKSFFTAAASTTSATSHPTRKRPSSSCSISKNAPLKIEKNSPIKKRLATMKSSSPPVKKKVKAQLPPKKGSITAFFSPHKG